MSKRLPIVWDADPHTIAKIAILKGYLNAWFRILGQRRAGETILYVDGFAGPGYYRNHNEGSPLAAIRVAEATLQSLGSKFIAEKLHCAFIEDRKDRYELLVEATAPFVGKQHLGITCHNCEFVEGIELVRKELPEPFRGEGPLFVFADPFGGTGIPFSTFANCMQGDTAELLINLDADGIGRMFSAENNKNRDAQLTDLFGGECWKQELTARGDFKQLSVQILDLYKKQLRTLPGVKFIWSFAMRGNQDTLIYHLVFATKHPLGMEKMKEAMKAIDKTGTYSFSDAHTEQEVLFRDDKPEIYAETLFRQFVGKAATLEDVNAFALSETPFLNAKAVLAVLEKQGRVRVEVHGNEPRKAGSFPEGKVRALHFSQFTTINEQKELGL
jgi:three-Cys-motif partner protein